MVTLKIEAQSGMTLTAKIKWIAIALLLVSCAEAQVHFAKVSQEKIEKRLEAAPEDQAGRATYLRSELLAAGCPAEHLKDEAVPNQKQPNIVCMIPGKTSRQIIVGAHYDFVTEGRGIVDNWSGASLLPSFVESLNGERRKHTLVFIAFTGEEEGMLGSKSYVAHLSKEERQSVDAMVNLDTLGLGPTKVWASDSSKPLVKSLFSVAGTINSPLAVMNVDGLGQSDNDSFREAHIPEICVHSVTQENLRVLHSRDDQLSSIHKNDYYESYRLMATYLATIDASLEGAAADQPSR